MKVRLVVCYHETPVQRVDKNCYPEDWLQSESSNKKHLLLGKGDEKKKLRENHTSI